MYQRFRVFILMPLIVAISCLSAGMVREAAASEKEMIYSGHIDEMIMRCESKVWMSDSKSRSIRGESVLSMLKGSFLKANKSDLIQDMIAAELGIKPHQMSYYLNKRFFEVLRTSADYCERQGTVNALN